MIIGKIGLADQPVVGGIVHLPRLGIRKRLEFLADTGAGGTVLHPRDTALLGVDFTQLKHPVTSHGVGGAASAFQENAQLLFRDNTTLEWHEYWLTVRIAEPTDYNRGYPSLLGRDVLRCWRTTYDPTNRILEFQVIRTIGQPSPE